MADPVDPAADLPLFRYPTTDRALRRRNARITLLCALATIPLTITAIRAPRPILVWNASASAPLGLYGVAPPTAIRTGDWVIARLPEPARSLAAGRHYLPSGVPMVKRVAAAPGDLVCARGAIILIDRRPAAPRRRFDAMGRLMPWWHGCRRLSHGALFLLNSDHRASFDGRYFGVSDRIDIIGKATLLWAR